MSNLIFLIGLPRSGTTWLGSLISKISGVCYLEEPRGIWDHICLSRCHDIITSEDAGTAEGIKLRDELLSRDSGLGILVEKSPANCLRVPFIKCTFPDARYIVLRRDRSQIVSSMVRKWTTGEDRNDLHLNDNTYFLGISKKQIQKFYSLSVRQKIYILPEILDILRSTITKSPRSLWGPRVPGLRSIRKSFSVQYTCEYQHDICDLYLQEGLKQIHDSSVLELDYSDLLENTDKVIAKVSNFIDIVNCDV